VIDDSKPIKTTVQDLPVFPASTAIDAVGQVRAALLDLENGQFARAAQLCDAFGNDDRLKGVLDTRVDALFGLQREVLPKGSDAAAVQLNEYFDEMFPSAELKTFLRWGLLLRVAFGRWEAVERSATETKFRFRNWDPRWCRWDWASRSFWTMTDAGTEVEITPGRNGWVVYAPDGLQRGWMQGLVRALGLLYLVRRWALRDWARRSEVLGQTIKLAIVPSGGYDEEDKKSFLASVRNVGRESVFRLAQDENGKGFDLKLLEATPGGEEGFRQLIEKCDECIAVAVLGQNLTTSAKGGSYAAADVHDRIRVDRLEGDGKSLGPCLREQAAKPWALANYGDAELAPTLGWQTNTNVSVDPSSGLNGAQVVAFKDVVLAVARGELPRDSGVQILLACFPITEEQAEEAMGECGRGFKPVAPATPPAGAPPGAKPPEDKDDGEEPEEEETKNAA
jgi:phage gp29-like protein